MNPGTEPTPIPSSTADEVLDAAERLADLFATAELHGRPGEAPAKVYEAIAPAVRSYEIGLKRLDPATLTADLRSRLRHVGNQLQSLAAQHETRLRARVEAQRRLIACVGEAVALAAAGHTYSRRGTLGTERQGRLPPPAATLSCAL